jgi:SAM-dependent methyltransferase
VADEYERVRPGYPAMLVDRACAVAGLAGGDAVLEIGCGTGKLTRELAARDLVVDAVEPDPELVAVASRILPAGSVRFHVGTFEEIELARSFPAAFAAASFHWVDRAVGWQKVARLLDRGGVFALFSDVGGIKDAVDEEVVQVWQDVSPDSARWQPLDDETLWRGVEARKGNASELWSWLFRHDHELAVPEAAELFGPPEVAREPFEREHSVEGFLARTRTSNHYLHLEPADRRRLEDGLAAVIERHGGTYRVRGDAVLVTARRV